MSDGVKRIALHSGEIRAFLMNDDTIKELVDDAAKKVEGALPEAVSNTQQRQKNGHIQTNYAQEPFNREGLEVHDRYKREVGIENHGYADKIYGTIERAVENSGGRRTK